MRGLNRYQQARIFEFAWWHDFARTPTLIAALGDPQQSAQLGDRILVAELIDHGVSHFDSEAKSAVAFFKISRSILVMANSRSSSRMRCDPV